MSLTNQNEKKKEETTAVIPDESSIVTIQKDIYNMFNAKWVKYGREITAREKTDVQALKSILKQVDELIEQENSKLMEDFTKDPKLQKTAMAQADQINDLMMSKWFRVDELQKALGNKMSREAILSSLATLQAFGLIMAKSGVNGTKFKVVFTREQRIATIQETQAQHQAEIDRLNKEIEELKAAPVVEAKDDDEPQQPKSTLTI